ncbi:MAG: ABC transporter substrate-binding protein [Ktedonobacteraceae bacterium]
MHDSICGITRRGQRGKAWITLAGMALVLALVLAACSGSTPATSTKYGGKISVGLSTNDVATLDPLKSTALVDRQVMLNIYDTLVRIDEHNTIVPDLATSWTYPSPTQLVFTLRTDVKFQDGTPFDAKAVLFNVNRILNTPASPRYSEMSNVQSVEAIDASHVRFNLKKAFSPLLATLTDRSGMMLSPAVVQKLGSQLGNGPINAGSGPFMFSEWVKGGHLTVTSNPHYWLKDAQGNALPYLQSIRYVPISNGSVMFSNLQTGTINVADALDPNDVASAKTNSTLVYKQIPGFSFFGMMLNTRVAPLDNVHVRRAIEWGVNRQEILTSVLKGIGVIAQGPISPSSWAYSSSFTPYTPNSTSAKTELAQAGKSGGVAFTLLIASNSPVNTQEAQFIQSELQPLGIAVTIKPETFVSLLTDTQAHNFQAALLGWSGRPDPDGNMFSWFHTGGGNNNMQYSNPQVDSLLEAARASSDQAQRTSDYQQAEQMILQDAPYVFINHGVSIQASTKNIQNFTLLPTGIMQFTQVYVG